MRYFSIYCDCIGSGSYWFVDRIYANSYESALAEVKRKNPKLANCTFKEVNHE